MHSRCATAVGYHGKVVATARDDHARLRTAILEEDLATEGPILTAEGISLVGSSIDTVVWNDKVYVFYSHHDEQAVGIYQATYDGQGWSQPEKIIERPAGTDTSFIAAPCGRNLLILWNDPEKGIVYRVLDNSGWSDQTGIVPSTQRRRMAARFDSAGNPVSRPYAYVAGRLVLLTESVTGGSYQTVAYAVENKKWDETGMDVPLSPAADTAFLGTKEMPEGLYCFTSRGPQNLIGYRVFGGEKWSGPLEITGTSDHRGSVVQVGSCKGMLVVVYETSVGLRYVMSSVDKISQIGQLVSRTSGFKMHAPILELHCPQAQGCSALYEEVYKGQSEFYYSVNVAGTGGGASLDVSVSCGTTYETLAQCVRIGIPVEVLATLWAVYNLKEPMGPTEDWDNFENWCIPPDKEQLDKSEVRVPVYRDDGSIHSKGVFLKESLGQRAHVLDVDTDGVSMVPIPESELEHPCSKSLEDVKDHGWPYDVFDMETVGPGVRLTKSFEIEQGLSAEIFTGVDGGFGGLVTVTVQVRVGVKVRLQRTVRTEYTLPGGRDYYRFRKHHEGLIWYWGVGEAGTKLLTGLHAAREFPVEALVGVGVKTAKALKARGIITLADLAGMLSPEAVASDTGLSPWLLRSLRRKADIVCETVFDDVYHEKLKGWPLRNTLIADSSELMSLTGLEDKAITDLKRKVTTLLMFIDSTRHDLLKFGKAG
jgi:hypothetical protein